MHLTRLLLVPVQSRVERANSFRPSLARALAPWPLSKHDVPDVHDDASQIAKPVTAPVRIASEVLDESRVWEVHPATLVCIEQSGHVVVAPPVAQVLPARGLWYHGRTRDAGKRLVLLLLCAHGRRAATAAAIATGPSVGIHVDLVTDHALDIYLRVHGHKALMAAGVSPFLARVDLVAHPAHANLLSAHLLSHSRLTRARGKIPRKKHLLGCNHGKFHDKLSLIELLGKQKFNFLYIIFIKRFILILRKLII